MQTTAFRPARRQLPRWLAAIAVMAALSATAGCGSTAPAINNPALGGTSSNIGISGTSGSGVQIYGVGDVGIGTSRTTITRGGS